MEWQLIETAPTNTILLLYCPDGIDRLYASPAAAKNYCLGFQGESGGMFGQPGWWSVESREEIWGYGGELTGPMSETECLSCEPTHWMPLPEAPASGMEARRAAAENTDAVHDSPTAATSGGDAQP